MRVLSFLVIFLLACTSNQYLDLYKTNVFEILQKNRIANGEDFKITKIDEDEYKTVNLVQVNSKVRAHCHSSHDELVFILEGQGKMLRGDEIISVKKGDMINIPRGLVHFFVNDSKEATVALSIFTPPFDGKDRIFVE